MVGQPAQPKIYTDLFCTTMGSILEYTTVLAMRLLCNPYWPSLRAHNGLSLPEKFSLTSRAILVSTTILVSRAVSVSRAASVSRH